MAAVINSGGIVFGGSANQVFAFAGQNIECGWDSHGPNLAVLGPQYGPGAVQWFAATQFNNFQVIGQPLINQSIKDIGNAQLES